MVTITRGDVTLCDLNPVVGTEQAGVCPVVVLQIDRANAVSPPTVYHENSSRPLVLSRVGSCWYWWLEPKFSRTLRADSGNR